MIPKQCAYSSSVTVGITDGVSEPFAVPSGFIGHVYVRPDGGDQQAVFLITSDGDADFRASAGYKLLVANNFLAKIDVVYDSKLRWRVTGALREPPLIDPPPPPPGHVPHIRVSLVGTAFESLPSTVRAAFSRTVTVRYHNGVSNAFDVPSGFTGHIYITGSRPKEQIILAIGCDDDGNFDNANGFVERIGFGDDFSAVSPNFEASRLWTLSGLPFLETGEVTISLVGVTREAPPTYIDLADHLK